MDKGVLRKLAQSQRSRQMWLSFGTFALLGIVARPYYGRNTDSIKKGELTMEKPANTTCVVCNLAEGKPCE